MTKDDKFLDFEAEEKRLDEILVELDNPELKLDQAVVLYNEGNRIVKRLREGLESLKNDVKHEITD